MTINGFQSPAVLVRLPQVIAGLDAIPRQTRPIAEHSDLYNVAHTY